MSKFVVENHPYDKGYFDAIEGRQKQCDWGEYYAGWRQAKSELRQEKKDAFERLVAASRRGSVLPRVS